ncbi:hypothetical protein ALNOE001_18180 [Candidatus Methanobinarius endosymbioticus]|uniref:Uncharacterized protein n=1 Tax=Candidatus Methanobinarius endosymbioticus TaxID=2006182 RepID=A0A366M8H3_9EURY|nr:hypothetical protein ALNOE001_17410 [Candidatus Methanobinarius endosymbioticus]RBQ22582.1 hypothetical protein ALNOE001_18180 [Candidatus Methanobinarius endosymbioticus]
MKRNLILNNELTKWLIFLDKNSPMELINMVTTKDENIKTAEEKIEELLSNELLLHDIHMRKQAG